MCTPKNVSLKKSWEDQNVYFQNIKDIERPLIPLLTGSGLLGGLCRSAVTQLSLESTAIKLPPRPVM